MELTNNWYLIDIVLTRGYCSRIMDYTYYIDNFCTVYNGRLLSTKNMVVSSYQDYMTDYEVASVRNVIQENNFGMRHLNKMKSGWTNFQKLFYLYGDESQLLALHHLRKYRELCSRLGVEYNEGAFNLFVTDSEYAIYGSMYADQDSKIDYFHKRKKESCGLELNEIIEVLKCGVRRAEVKIVGSGSDLVSSVPTKVLESYYNKNTGIPFNIWMKSVAISRPQCFWLKTYQFDDIPDRSWVSYDDISNLLITRERKTEIDEYIKMREGNCDIQHSLSGWGMLEIIYYIYQDKYRVQRSTDRGKIIFRDKNDRRYWWDHNTQLATPIDEEIKPPVKPETSKPTFMGKPIHLYDTLYNGGETTNDVHDDYVRGDESCDTYFSSDLSIVTNTAMPDYKYRRYPIRAFDIGKEPPLTPNEIVKKYKAVEEVDSTDEFDVSDARLDKRTELDKWHKKKLKTTITVGDHVWGIDDYSVDGIRIRLGLMRGIDRYYIFIHDYLGNKYEDVRRVRLENILGRQMRERNKIKELYDSYSKAIEEATSVFGVRDIKFEL